MQESMLQSPPAPSPDQPVPDEFDLVCEHCGYSLVGLTTSNRCPECGETFDPFGLPLARVPWLFRKRLGKLTTYRDTVIEIVRRPRAFAKELCRPVRLCAEDARQFRRMSIRIAVASCLLIASILAASGATQILRGWNGFTWRDVGHIVAVCLFILWFAVVLSFFFRLATDLPTFIWRGLENNPIDLAPLHHYASAPLAILPILVLPIAMWFVGNSENMFGAVVAGIVISVVMVAVVLIMIWVIAVRLMRAATSCGPGRAIALALYLPVHWALMFMLCALGFMLGCAAIGGIVSFIMEGW